MDANKIVKHLDELFENFKKDFVADIDNKIEIAMSTYRSAIIVGDKWCCKAMEETAASVFGVNKRTAGNFTFQNSLAIQNNHMVYCPFCGVKL